MVKSRLLGGECVLSFEYEMPMGKERLGSSIPDSWQLLGSKPLTIDNLVYCQSTCHWTHRFAKEVVSSSS